MALSAGHPVLEAAIIDAYMTAKTNGEEGKMTADQVIQKLAKDIAAAVHAYTQTATVNTIVAGAAVGPPAPVNPVSAVVTGTGLGMLS